MISRPRKVQRSELARTKKKTMSMLRSPLNPALSLSLFHLSISRSPQFRRVYRITGRIIHGRTSRPASRVRMPLFVTGALIRRAGYGYERPAERRDDLALNGPCGVVGDR